VKRLTNDQLKGIFTGKIQNWKDVGGEEQDIIVAWGKDTQGQNIQFTRTVLGGDTVTTKVMQCNDYRGIIQKVSETPGAIGIAPFGMTTSNVHLPEIPPIISPVYLITKGKPSNKVQHFIDFYKKESEIN
jgi:phosphate transport system substrate-binding protein